MNKQLVAPRDCVRPWTADEHTRFIDALEMYASYESPWAAIAQYVQTRSEAETKEHGEFYLHALLTQSLLDTNQEKAWTKEENEIFENALAQYTPATMSWTKISMALPGKTVHDVMDHYERLVRDLLAIEKGIGLNTSAVEAELRVANMNLIANITSSCQSPGLYDAYREAHDNLCSVEAASYIATSVVNILSSKTHNRDAQKVPTISSVDDNTQVKRKIKSNNVLCDEKEMVLLPPLKNK
ncbi:hypothetical protein THRCLA_08657 [Thraustotheca clavata]|uniref:Myb-like domain-containing protein n=1 Tax=Thraustotheca clavata TaxID=74557 RepID=A0A1V9Z3M4_9STRA|nr:hypothetical protein THRCLA_08657 [Thraustotheca clavata]